MSWLWGRIWQRVESQRHDDAERLGYFSDGFQMVVKALHRGAAEAGVSIHTQCIDLDSEPLPVGPWDVILSVCFLWRPLFAEIPKVLAPDGWLVVIQPTLRNLERHDKPPAQFLLQENELPSLIQGLEVVRYEEGWLADGRHDAFLVARRLIGNVKTPIR